MRSDMQKRVKSDQLCACGCGEYTFIIQQENKGQERTKGEPNKFIHGHHARGKNHYNWENGIIESDGQGYCLVYCPEHIHATNLGYVRRSHLVVEKALGKILSRKIIVHHINSIRNDDRPKNLVVCENHAYHNLLHQRQRAFKNCGHANWLKCPFCKKYDDPENLYISPNGQKKYHKECRKKHYYQQKKI